MDEIFEKYPNFIKEYLVVLNKTDYNGMKPWTEERLKEEPTPLFKALMRDYTLHIHE